MENTKIKPGKEGNAPAFEYVDNLWSTKYKEGSWVHHNSNVDKHDDSNWSTDRAAVVKRG